MLCTLGSSLTHNNAVSPMSPFAKRNQKLSTIYSIFLKQYQKITSTPPFMTSWNSRHSMDQGEEIGGPNVLRAVRMVHVFLNERYTVLCTLLCRSNLDNHLRLVICVYLIFQVSYLPKWCRISSIKGMIASVILVIALRGQMSPSDQPAPCA